MTAKFERELRLDVPAERLLQLIIDPEFQQQQALDLGALEARCQRADLADGTVELVLHEKSSPKWGQSHRTTLTSRWDLSQLCSRWQRVVHGQEQRSRAEGSSRIIADDGESCRLVMQGEVEVRVPVLGRKVERKVVEEIEAGREREQRYLEQRLGQGRG